jgi:hypothetical protein
MQTLDAHGALKPERGLLSLLVLRYSEIPTVTHRTPASVNVALDGPVSTPKEKNV